MKTSKEYIEMNEEEKDEFERSDLQKDPLVKVNDEKWKRINVLTGLVRKIEKLVRAKKYSSIPAFVDLSIREKLIKEGV
ncbi:MAG: hypothetical protein ACFFD2_00435 [Promethearchaeota archaeon]